MKVLISDDEHHVIQAIRLLVPWEEFGIDKFILPQTAWRR